MSRRRTTIPLAEDEKTASISHVSSSSSEESLRIPKITDAPRQSIRKSISEDQKEMQSALADESSKSQRGSETLELPKYKRLTSEPVAIKKEPTLKSSISQRPSSAPAIMQRDNNGKAPAQQLQTEDTPRLSK